MRLTLIQDKKVHFLSLPGEITGQYIMPFTRGDGAEDSLLSIRPENGKWYAECGMNAYLKINGRNYRACPIERPGFSTNVVIRANGEAALLLAEDDSAEMTGFQKYSVNGRFTVGRDAGCDIVLNSAHAFAHCAEFTADEKMMKVTAAEGAYVFVNSERVSECVLKPGDVVFVCGYTFICGQRLIAADRAPLLKVRSSGSVSPYVMPPEETGEMTYFFDDVKSEKYIYVSPRFIPKPEHYEITIANPPAAHNANGQPAVLSLGPAFTMGIASAATGTFSVLNAMSNSGGAIPNSVIPTMVMTGSMVASSLLWPLINKGYTKLKDRRDERRRKSVYLQYLQNIEKEIASGMESQLSLMHKKYPGAENLRDRIRLSASSLWERSSVDDDFLNICIGVGSVPFDCTIKSQIPPMEVKPDILFEELRKVAGRDYELENAPVTVDLRRDIVCGIVGDTSQTAGFVNGIILQLASLYSYKELKIALIYDESEEKLWSSPRWLPHAWDDKRETRYIAANAEELNVLSSVLESELAECGEAQSQTNAEAAGRYYVIICTSKRLASKTSLLSHIVQKGRYVNFSFIAVYPDERFLPKESTAVMRFCGSRETIDRTGSAERCLMLKTRDAAEPRMLSPMTVPPAEFNESAVGLADKRLGSEENGYDMPDMLTFLEMYGVKTIEELNCLQRWHTNSSVRSLAAPLGVDSRGDLFNLDLHQKAHGPHGLIAGTTGSGKSEFIMTMILSLAVNYSPHDISFLLIDYKGGGMAVAFEKLPHVAGIITNLDGAAVNRSLISIQSELKRRQALFLEEGKRLGTNIGDIYKYQKLYKEGRITRPLQHLYIISDEFAELKSQQPDFMSELISAARIGRSLGVHLILATQKPSGVVNDQIWSNSRFKICLKVQERADSMDVIRCPDAAAITQTGRFYLQVGYNEIFEMGQSAWAGAKYDPSADTKNQVDDSVEIIDNAGRVIMQAENEKRRLIESARKPADSSEHDTQLQEITRYLTALCEKEGVFADRLWLDPIPGVIYTYALEKKYGFKHEHDRLSVVVGEYDVPQKQSQRILALSPQDGNIIVYGSAGNGKTTFLLAYIFGMLKQYSARENVFYIIDYASETLRAFSGYDAVGAVCTAREPDKVRNLFSYIDSVMKQRKELFSANGGDFLSYRREHGDMPAIQLVIANIGAFCENAEYDEQLDQIAREGSKLGIYMIASQLNAVVKHRLAMNFSQVFCMRLNNGAYCDVISSVGRMVPAKFKGRGLFRSEFTSEFQTAYITDREDVFEYVKEQEEAVNTSHGGEKARRIMVLPRVFTPAYAMELSSDQMHPAVALERTSVEPVTVDLNNRVSLFVTQSSSFVPIADAFCAMAKSSHRMFVFDENGGLDGSVPGSYSEERIDDGIRELYRLALERNHYAKEQADSGKTVDFSADQYVCVITDLGSLLSRLRSRAEDERAAEDKRLIAAVQAGEKDIVPVRTMRDTEQMMTMLLTGGAHDFGISFVIFDNAAKLIGYRQEKWFAQHIRLKNYFWIGAGLGMENRYPHQPLNDMRIDFGDDLGWSISGGRASMVRFVSTLPDV